MAFDQRWKRPLPARPEYAREQRLIAVTEVFDVLHVELMGSGFEHCSRHSQAPVSEDRTSLIFAQCSPDRNVPHASDGVPAFNFDRAETVATVERLKKIAANLKATIIIQHDARDVDKLPVFPASAK